jgi:PKD repeat protein
MVSGSIVLRRRALLRSWRPWAAAALLLCLLGTTVAGAPTVPTLAPPRAAAPLPAPHDTPRAVPASPRSAASTLTITGQTPRAAELSWTSPTVLDFENYTLEYSTQGASGTFTVATVITSQTTLTYVDNDLTPGANYTWKLLIYALIGTSTGNGNEVVATQPTLPYLTFSSPTSTSAAFAWTNNASYGGSLAFGSYGIFESENGAAPTRVALLTEADQNDDVVTGLPSGQSYTFYVNTTDCISGCGTASNTSVTESNAVTFGTIRPLVASISAERSLLDVGQPDYFTCTPSGGSAPYTFSWDYGNNSSAPGEAAESHAFASPGAPTVSCLVTDASLSQSSAATSLTVDPDPVLNLTINRTTADRGEPIAFGCTSTNGTAPVGLGWSFGNGASAATANTSYGYPSNGSFVATCTATDFTGTVTSEGRLINISTDPSAMLQATELAVAPGTPVSVAVVLSGGVGPFSTPAWSYGDGGQSTGNDLEHVYTKAGNFTVEVRAVDANGIAANASVRITVSPVSVVVSALPTTLTIGVNYSFTATPSGGAGGPYNVTWTFGNGNLVVGDSVLHHFKDTGPAKVELSVSDRAGATTYRNLSLTIVAPTTPSASSSVWQNGFWILIPALIVALLVGLLALGFFRRREERPSSGAAQYVLPTDPERTLKGVRVCRNCGTPNNAARESCSSCGAELGSSLFG